MYILWKGTVSGKLPETKWKLCLSAKFPHQKIKWNHVILCSECMCICSKNSFSNCLFILAIFKKLFSYWFLCILSASSGCKLDCKKIWCLLELTISEELATHHGWTTKKILSSSLSTLPILAFFHVNFCYISGYEKQHTVKESHKKSKSLSAKH